MNNFLLAVCYKDNQNFMKPEFQQISDKKHTIF